MNLVYRKYNLKMNGNKMSGDTFPVRGFIKDHLDGKWDANNRVWIVNPEKVSYWMEKHVINEVAEVTKPAPARADNGWCNKCHSYCWGDCTAH